MTDIQRNRKSYKAPMGQTPLIGVPDNPEALAHGQHQENIEALAELNHARAKEVAALQALIDGLDIPEDASKELLKLRRRIEALEEEIKKVGGTSEDDLAYFKVISDETTYAFCNRYTPEKELTASEVTAVAKPRTSDGTYSVDDIILCLAINTGLQDSFGRDIVWEDVGLGGGGGGGVTVVASYAALAALSDPSDGDLGYVEDKDRFYGRSNGAWRVLQTFVDTAAPSSVGETDGDRWYDSTFDRPFMYINGAWENIPYRKPDNRLYYYDGTAERQISHLA